MSSPKDPKTPAEAKTLMADAIPPEVEQARARMRAAQSTGGGGRLAGAGPPPPAAAPAGGVPRGPAPSPAPSGQATVMLDAAPAPQGRPVHPAAGPGASFAQGAYVASAARVPVPGGRPWWRWIVGPLLSLVVAFGVAGLARAVTGRKAAGTEAGRKGGIFSPRRNLGKIKVQSDPPGATVKVNGRPHPHFTPTFIDGDVGSTLHIELELDGYEPKDETVYVSAGEHAFSLKLQRIAEEVPAPESPQVEPSSPPPASPASPPREHRSTRESRRRSAAADPFHPVGDQGAVAPPPARSTAGRGSISVFVRPWAIVFIDGVRLRQTPIDKFELPAGRHTLELVNETKARHEKVPLTVQAGQHQELRYDWDK